MFSLAALSMIGMPPVCGFVSKWYLINGAMQAHQVIILCALLGSTILNAGYFTPIIYRAFFMAPSPAVDYDHCAEAPMTMVIPLTITAVISVLLGFFPQIFFSFINVFTKFGG